MSQTRWEDLFAPAEAGKTETVSLACLRKGDEPLLLLPVDPKMQKPALSLYPAQRLGARLARGTLRHASGLGLPASLKKASVTVSPRDAFVQFMAKAASHPKDVVPPFAIFAGNPRAPGRRFIVLVYDRNRQPVAAIKAGVGPDANRLIDREVIFLKSAPRGTTGVPQLTGEFASERIHAFATGFVAGKSPTARNQEQIETLLNAWVDTTRSAKFFGRTCHPALVHGDFAPWNVRVSSGDLTVLDWERGELAGVPGWDWFHYLVQPAILVQRQETGKLLRVVEDLLESSAFNAYATRAGIAGVERELFREYLSCRLKESSTADEAPRLRELLERWASV